MTRMIKTIIYLLLIVGGGTYSLSAQSNTVVKTFDILAGTVVKDTIQSVTQPTQKININSQFGQSTFQNIGSGRWEVTLWLNNNHIGTEDIIIEHSRIIPPSPAPRPAYVVYTLNTFPSIVKPVDDLVVWNGEETLTISALDNDFSSTGQLELRGIAHVLNGSASTDGNQIIYTPGEDFSGDYIVYTAIDSIGTAGQGVVYIISEDNNFSGNTTVVSYISYKSKHLMIMPNADFNYMGGHSNGRFETIGTLGYVYKPNSGYTGIQTLNFSDNNGNTVTHIIHVINADTDSGVVKDDEVYTARNTPVTFNVLANDLTNNFPITFFSPELIRDTLGVFTYNPPAGFSGVKNFIYRVKYGNITETGKITVYVGNQEPLTSLQYSFNVLKDRDFVMEYEVPVNGYHFNVLNAPLHGIVETFANGETVTLECGTVTSRASVIYTPDNGYTGNDEFDIQYCINGTQCRIYKVKISVLESDDDDCNCVSDCVWMGDTNGDGRVSVTDLLPIGRFMGYAGSERELGDSDMWYGRTASNWNHTLRNGKNLKHVDINGDGLITADDRDGLESNLGKIRSFVPNEVLAIKDVPVNLIVRTPEVEPGDMMIIDIAIGNAQFPMVDAHGLALGFVLPPSIVDSSSLSLTFLRDEWFSRNSPTLQLSHQVSKGSIQGAFTRTSGIPTSGFGVIATLNFIVEEELDGLKDIEENRSITIPVFALDGIYEDGSGIRFKIPDSQAQFVLRKKSTIVEESNLTLLSYPNPANNVLNLFANGNQMIEGFTLINASGQIVRSLKSISDKNISIDLADLNEGMYILKTNTSAKTYTQKVVIIKK